MASTVGLMFPACIGIGYAWGFFMDKWLNSNPWFTIVFSGLGIFAAFLNVYRLAVLLTKENGKNGAD